MVNPPERLKRVPIAEALFEIRFVSSELPELVVGAMAAHWKEFKAHRLPLADIPHPFRKANPALQYQALMELRRPDGARIVKIGEQSVSYHALGHYPGWSAWCPELLQVIDFVFGGLGQFEATRLGLRYLNAFTPDHFVTSVRDLDVSVAIGDAPIAVPMLLNYEAQDDAGRSMSLIRIASREFIVNPSPNNLTALVDVDVHTPINFRTSDVESAKSWLSDAHEFEKREFFKLIDDELLLKLQS